MEKLSMLTKTLFLNNLDFVFIVLVIYCLKWTKGANLHSEKVVNSRDNDVDGCVVPCLRPQVVLEVWKKILQKIAMSCLPCVQIENQ